MDKKARESSYIAANAFKPVIQPFGLLVALLFTTGVCYASQLPDAARQQLCRQLAQSVPASVSADQLTPRQSWWALPTLRRQPVTAFQHQALRFGFANDLSTLDVDQDGRDDLAYGVDVIGQVWRFRLQGSQWRGADHLPAVVRLAELGGAVHTLQDALARVFQMPPALAFLRDPVSGQSVVSLAIASGWTRLPHASLHRDGLFVIRDSAPFGGADVTDSLRVDASQTQVISWQEAASQSALKAPLLMVLWLDALGEKAIVSPIILQGVTYFVTYLPDPDATGCPPLSGHSRLYSLDLRTARPAWLPVGQVVADAGDFRHPEILPAAAAWLGVDWSLPPADGPMVLQLAGQQITGPILSRRIETLQWQRVPVQ